jgi:hypothetical protein
MAKMTVEEFMVFAKAENLDEAATRKVSKALGIVLPVEIKPLKDQLSAVGIVKHVPKQTKRNPNPQETEYVVVPSLKLNENSGLRGFWVKASVARQIASRIIEICDEKGL